MEVAMPSEEPRVWTQKSRLGFSPGQETSTQNSGWSTSPHTATDATACLKECWRSQAPCWTTVGARHTLTHTRPRTGSALPGELHAGHWHEVPGHPPRPVLCSPPDLDKFLLLQIPLLDAVVPGAAEKDISLDGQALDAVVVRGLKVVRGANVAHHALRDLKHLGKSSG